MARKGRDERVGEEGGGEGMAVRKGEEGSRGEVKDDCRLH